MNDNLLLELNVNQRWRNICNDLKSSGGKNHGSVISWGPRNRGLCSVNNLNLNCLTRNASSWNSRTDTSHLIQPPTCCTIVPYTLSSRTKHVGRRKLRRTSPKTFCRCRISQNTTISLINNFNLLEFHVCSNSTVHQMHRISGAEEEEGHLRKKGGP